MLHKPLILKLLRDLWQRRGTLFALIMVLVIGVGAYVGMDGVYFDLDNARLSYYHDYNLADFTLNLKRAAEVSAFPLDNAPNILRLRPRIQLEVITKLKDGTLIPGVVSSLPVPRRDIINNIRLLNGTWFSSPYAREAIINAQFAAARHLHVGDRLKIHLPDKEYNLLIVGTAASPEFVSILAPGSLAPDPGGYAIMYLPHKFLQERADLNGSFNQLLGMVQDNSKIAIQNTMTLLSDKLDNYGVQLQTAQEDQFAAKVLADELVNVRKVTTIFPTMFFLVAILILNVMISRLVTQQRGIIGTLKALGYGNCSILCHYAAYGVVIGLIGGILGMFLGFALQYSMLEQYKAFFSLPKMTVHIYPGIIIFGIFISILSALLGVIFGARKAIKLAPAEAMRPPVPEKGSHIILERWHKFWQQLSFQGKMVMRAIFRNRFRSLVTIAASILATALVFSSLEILDSMYKMVEVPFTIVQHQDYNLTLREPLGSDVLSVARTIKGVKKVEGQLVVAAELQNGPFIKRLSVTGLPQNSSLYTPVDNKEKPIKIGSSGLVINKTLADILHLKKGDYVTLKPLIGNRTPARVKVSKVIRTYLGLSVYADQAWFSRLLGNSYLLNHLLFKLNKGADKKYFMNAINKFAPLVNISSRQHQAQLLLDTLDKYMIFAVVIMVFFAGVIAMGSILNTAMISLNERERDVASLRVLGFTNKQVATIFFGESILLNSIGIFLGLFVGIYFAYYMSYAFSTEIYRMPMVIYAKRLLETVLIMALFVLTSQVIIYHIIKRLSWFDVLNARE